MGNSLHKVNGIQLPGQSGKTRKMEEKLSEYMAQTRNEGSEDDLNIMFTSNSRLLVQQTSVRFDDDLGPKISDSNSEKSYNSYDSDNFEESIAILKNGCATWTSSKNQTSKELAWDILNDEIDMIVCCSHPTRMKKMFADGGLIDILERQKLFRKNINIWIDEAHKSIRLWKKYLNILKFRKIKRVFLVSASWDPIDKEFTIPRIPYKQTFPDVYRSLHECEWKIIEHSLKDADELKDSNSTAPSYIAQILSIPEIQNYITPGTIWLTPGNSKTATHDAIAEDLIAQGWNGLKLNGFEKSITFYIDKTVIDYNSYNKEGREPKDVIAKAFEEFPNLYDAPFFITGLNCIKEGITFQSNNILFRGAIIPPISDPSDAYQLACRVAGNIKQHEAYDPDISCLIITTSKMEKKIKYQENINIFLPRILYEEGRTIPTKFDKSRAGRGKCSHDPKGLGYRIFKDYDTFKEFLYYLKIRSGFDGKPNGPDKKGNYVDLYICSVQSNRGAEQQPRYVTEVIDKIDLAYGGKGNRSGFPAYTDLKEENGFINPNNEDLVWIAVVPDSLDKKTIEDADTIYPSQTIEILKVSKHYTDIHN